MKKEYIKNQIIKILLDTYLPIGKEWEEYHKKYFGTIQDVKLHFLKLRDMWPVKYTRCVIIDTPQEQNDDPQNNKTK